MRQLKKAMTPFIKSFNIDWGDIKPNLYMQTPNAPSSLSKGESITVFGLLKYEKFDEVKGTPVTLTYEHLNGQTGSIQLVIEEEREGDIIGNLNKPI